MCRSCQLTRSAAADLEDIPTCTRRHWGDAQCAAYLAQLDHTACELAEGRGVYRQFDDIEPGLRAGLSGHHYVFCLPQDTKPALMLAILHERMDLMMRLKRCLNP